MLLFPSGILGNFFHFGMYVFWSWNQCHMFYCIFRIKIFSNFTAYDSNYEIATIFGPIIKQNEKKCDTCCDTVLLYKKIYITLSLT